MHDIAKLGEKVEELRSEILALSEVADLDETQEARWAAANAEFDAAKADLDAAEARAARVAAVRDTVVPASVAEPTVVRSAPNVIVRKSDGFEVLETRGAGMSDTEYRAALVDASLRAADGNIEGTENQAHFERMVKKHSKDTRWAENILARQKPLYVSAFSKIMQGNELMLTNEERAALSVGSNTNGGFLVPTHLDPSIILTNNGSTNPIRAISRVVTLTDGNQWNGVTSAGVTASWDAELAEVSDDSPTFARVSVPVYKAQAFLQASVEAFEDISSLGSDAVMLLADARDRLESAAFATGSGSGQPTGIFTALDANTNVEVTSGTAATIALADLHGLYAAVPVRWRSKGSWLMAPTYSLAIKALGTAVSASFSGDLRDGTAGSILGKPVVESDDAPTTQTTTVRDNEIVFGDFSNYVIADKPGSTSIELIPHLFATANNLPDGRRGYYMHWRTGADSVNDLAFRLLQDKTSA